MRLTAFPFQITGEESMFIKPKKYSHRYALGVAMVGGLFFSSLVAGPALAADATEDLIKLLQAKGVLKPEEASTFIEQNRQEKAASTTSTASAKTITVVPGGERYLQTLTDSVAKDIKEDVKQEVKNELREEIAKDVKLDASTASVPDWTKRIRFGGDIRVRHQSDYFDSANATFVKPDKPTEILNSTLDRHRERYRIRVGAQIKVNEQVEGEVKLATGNETDPVSTNDTMGDYFNKDAATFDLGYVRWKPLAGSSLWTGDLALTVGRMPNPFFSSDLVWDKDVNPEGAALNLMVPIGPRFKGHLAAGAFSIQEVELSTEDKWLYGGQVGLEYAPRTTFNAKLAAGYYDYRNIEGSMNAAGLTLNDFTAPQYIQKGNSIFDINPLAGSSNYKAALAMDYNEVNLIGTVDVGVFDPIHVVFLGDYVKNVGYDAADILARTGSQVEENTTGYQYGIAVGYPTVQQLWDWKVSLFYKYLESDAVLDAFTDSDFHGGGTNTKGWILGGDLGVYNNVWLATRWYSTTEVSGPPFAMDTLQLDLNAKF
jgi:hypothetical protein